MLGLAWLQALLSGDKSLHLNFLNNSGKSVKNSRKSTSAITNNFNGPVNIINFNGPLDDSTRKTLQPLIDSFEKKQVLFLADEPKKLLSDVTRSEEDDLVRGLLNFFKPKLSVRDFLMMRTGLYLKYLRDNNRKDAATKLWKQALENNTPREKRIINLASADYFHTYFRPLYKHLSKGENAQAKFEKQFENILDELTFAIFVPSNMTTDGIVEKVILLAVKNIRYGVQTEIISLHATGRGLVERVKEAVRILKPKFPVIKVNAVSKGMDIITVQIEYRKNNLDDEDFAAAKQTKS